MAQKLLSLHMDVTKKQHEIDEIVENLTSKSYYHGHPIGRNEAAEHIKIPTITMPSPDCEEIMWNLYLEYEKELKMEVPQDSGRWDKMEHHEFTNSQEGSTGLQDQKKHGQGNRT